MSKDPSLLISGAVGMTLYRQIERTARSTRLSPFPIIAVRERNPHPVPVYTESHKNDRN